MIYMMTQKRFRRFAEAILSIIYRNVFLLTNGIMLVVVVLLFVFGATQAGIFLSIVSILNTIFGLAQDIRAWLMLERLQLMTAPRALRIAHDGSEVSVFADEVRKGDRIKIEVGNQVASDGELETALNVEVNEGLITGESNSIAKAKGDQLLAGSIITSGVGVLVAAASFHESRIAHMTKGIKQYVSQSSPIQDAVARIVKYSGFVFLAVLVFIVSRGLIVHEDTVDIVLNIGALASMLIPQGLVFMVTLFFAYGAAHFFQRNVLLQEINATEKLGRIKNLCMDKTGTLTENGLKVESLEVAPGVSEEDAERFSLAYVQGVGVTSENMRAIKSFLHRDFVEEITETLAFSSWRRYGAVSIKNNIVLAGPPDVFLHHLSIKDKTWLEGIVAEHASLGKHILCFARSRGVDVPRELSAIEPALLCVFIFYNNLREGVRDSIQFFQNRGVRIRIISGDHPETVRAVAALSGINHTDTLITGPEMASWSRSDFEKKVAEYTIFAQIVPEQKEKIIEAFKQDGFTAMVGDGANDALALKKADLGIAMFDGAAATRQVASVVLTNNSFAALPGGVELADGIIRNIELFASIFLNLTFLGLFLFIAVSILGYAYPLTPLNITLIDYFTIGIPGLLISYWAIRPHGKTLPASVDSFMRRVIPFSLVSALLQALGLVTIFMISPEMLIPAFIVLGFIFFAVAPGVYRGEIVQREKTQIFLLAMFELALFVLVYRTPFALTFFNVAYAEPSLSQSVWILLVLDIAGGAQYAIARFFATRLRVVKLP
jgi:cation-transporting ATPase E